MDMRKETGCALIWHIVQTTPENGREEMHFVGTKGELLNALEYALKGYLMAYEEDTEYFTFMEDEATVLAVARTKKGINPAQTATVRAVNVLALNPLFVTTKEEYKKNQAEDREYDLL